MKQEIEKKIKKNRYFCFKPLKKIIFMATKEMDQA